MVEINTLFTLGNILLLLASFPLLYSVWTDRRVLRGFNPFGAGLTFVALLVFCVTYIRMENWWSLIISQPTVVFWMMATIFSWYNQKDIPSHGELG
jgi:hypothetical protein